VREFTRQEVVQSVADAIEALGFAWEPSDGEHLHLFEDIGLDSLDGFDMVVLLETAFESPADSDTFARTFTIRSVIESACYVLKKEGRFK
jgi:acyl carrier protein